MNGSSPLGNRFITDSNQTIWFEFLLNQSLLEEHLSKDNQDPSATQLIAQFLEHAANSSLQNSAAASAQPPSAPGDEAAASALNARTQKIKALTFLALKTAAHLKWNLAVLEKGIPKHMVHSLLTGMLALLGVVGPPLQVDFSSQLHPYCLALLVIYHRWCLRVIVKDSFHSKSAKGKSTVGGGPDAGNQANSNPNEKIIQGIKEGANKSLGFLEQFLISDLGLELPGLSVVGQLIREGAPLASLSSADGVAVPGPELRCQLSYDLATFYFYKEEYSRAGQLFSQADNLLPELSCQQEDMLFCCIDKNKLAGYCQACQYVVGNEVAPTPAATLEQRIELSRHHQYQGLVALLVEDNLARERVPMAYRSLLELDLRGGGAEGVAGGGELLFECLACNRLRLVMEGKAGLADLTHSLRLTPSPQRCHFIFKICLQCFHGEQDQKIRRRISQFLRRLCLGSVQVWEQLLASDAKELIAEEDLLQIREVHAASTLSQDTSTTMDTHQPPSGDEPLALEVGRLEHQLLLSIDPQQIQAALQALHALVPGQRHSTLCHKWRLEKSYSSCIDGFQSLQLQDLAFILLVKADHCTKTQAFGEARALLEEAHRVVGAVSPKLGRAIQHQILCTQLQAQGLGGARGGDSPHPQGGQGGLVAQVRQCLQASPRQAVEEQCVAFLLNQRTPHALLGLGPAHNSPYIILGQLLARTCQDLWKRQEQEAPGGQALGDQGPGGQGPGDEGSGVKKAARQLWDYMAAVFAIPGHARRNPGHHGNQPPISRAKLEVFLDRLTDKACLGCLISCLAKIYNSLSEDVADIASTQYSWLWPPSLTSGVPVSGEWVYQALIFLVSHALAIHPTASWLLVQADIHFARGNYRPALHHYLRAGLGPSVAFSRPVPTQVWPPLVYRRMLRCCSQLQCFTQAAILCQFFQPVDHAFAFKVLQERLCYDAMEALYQYIWDIEMLEFIIYIHHKNGENEKKQIALQVMGQPELNSHNPEPQRAQVRENRKSRFLQALAKQYL